MVLDHPRRARIAMVGHWLGVVEDRLLGRDAAQMERKCVHFLVYARQSAMEAFDLV